MKKIQSLKVVFLAGSILLAGCSAKVDNRGYSNDEEWKKEIIAGQTTKDQVLARLGSPSSKSTFGDESWYYISEHKEGYGMFKSKVIDQDVFRINFDGEMVKSVEDYGKNDGKDFALVKRTTPTEGHSLGVIEQALGNIGRFNNPAGAASGGGIAPGRNPNGHY